MRKAMCTASLAKPSIVHLALLPHATPSTKTVTQVDESVAKMEKTVPPVVKQVSSQAYSVARNAPEVAHGVASKVQCVGLMDTTSGIAKNIYTTYEPTAKVLYNKYEPVAEQHAVSAWQSLNHLPLFSQVAQVVVPTATMCSEKYNQTVKVGAEKGFRVANYMPLVPTERIAKVFGAYDGELQPIANEKSVAVSAH
ncbi:hypothetical protein RND81_02G227400 [Saponaria officinalis]|uniref:Uncharacterized protein n=1 Tax=Saponaria officinalis TaxID=3572 RepID=A0AAW1MNB1_SAPOF